MDATRVGVIGCGYWGPNLIRNLVEIPTAEVVGVADLREERLNYISNTYRFIKTTTRYQDLFDMDLDAVVIATPPSTHFALAREALEHGLHVLVEKPMTTNGCDAEELINISTKRNLTLMVGHTFEFNSAVHALKTLIENGEIGKVLYVDTARLNLGLFQRDMNALWDLAPHDISILMYILNAAPLSVEVYGMDCILKGVHDVVYMNMIFPGNVLAHIHVSWLDPCKVRRVTVVGTQKMVVYNDVEALEKIKIYDKRVEALDYTNNYGEFQCSYRYGDVIIPSIKNAEPLRQECSHFIDCIRNHKTPNTNGEEGLRIVRVLEAAQSSLMNSHHKEVFTW